MPEKVFTPEVIEETPFPGETSELLGESVRSVSGEVHSPTISREKSVRRKRAAIELLSQALNTKSKKILQEFQFTDSGALQIGKFLAGISGDLRISPNGITARDQAGITTLAIDGSTGDAIFKGDIRAGSLITGEVIVGNNSIIIDGKNKRIIINDGEKDRVLIGFQKDGF